MPLAGPCSPELGLRPDDLRRAPMDAQDDVTRGSSPSGWAARNDASRGSGPSRPRAGGPIHPGLAAGLAANPGPYRDEEFTWSSV